MIDSSDFRLMKLVHALVWSGLVISGLAVLTACSPAAEKAPPIPAVYVTPVHNDHGEDMRILSGAVRPRIESDLAFRAGLEVQHDCGGYRLVNADRSYVFPTPGVCPTATARECVTFLMGWIAGRVAFASLF